MEAENGMAGTAEKPQIAPAAGTAQASPPHPASLDTCQPAAAGSPASDKDPGQIEVLVRRWMKPLYGFALGKTRRIDEAEELSSRMVEGLFRSLLRTGIPRYPSAYVWRLASNQWSRWLEERGRPDNPAGHENFDEVLHSPAYATGPADILEQEETMGLLRREIAWLSSTQRQVVIRHYFDQQSVGQIARELALPSGTVKWHLSAARQDLRKGMETMRSIGELGIKPVKFSWMGHCGTPGKRGDTAHFLAKPLAQNLVWACYHQERSLEEMAQELGVSPVFLGPEVAELEEFGFLERQKAGRYRAQILIEEYRPKQIEAMTALYREYAPRLSAAWVEPLLAKEADFAASGLIYPDKDWNTLLWSLIPWGLGQRFWQAPTQGNWGEFVVDRPDGGRYIASAGMPVELGGADPGFLDGRYSTCGDMNRWARHESRDGTSQGWQSWQLDTFWSERQGGWEECRDSDLQLLVRYLAGELSPEFNLDEYRRLIDCHYLSRTPEGFKLEIILAPDIVVRDQVWNLVHNADAATLDLVKDFDRAMLDLILPAYPSHMRPLARAMNQNLASAGRMRAFILEHLVNTGWLKPPRQEHKASLSIMVWPE